MYVYGVSKRQKYIHACFSSFSGNKRTERKEYLLVQIRISAVLQIQDASFLLLPNAFYARQNGFFHFYFPPRRNLERFTRPQFATKEPKEKKILKFRASCHLASRQSKVFSVLVSDCTRNAPTQIILPILKPAISKL